MSTPKKHIAFHTLGCKLNFSETSLISRDFAKFGFKQVNYKEKADFYVFNTCSVTENADREARKLVRQVKRQNPFSIVALIGCYAQLKPQEISKIEGVDLVLGAEEKFNLINHLDNLDINSGTKIFNSKIENIKEFVPSYSYNERTRSYLKVQDGCDYNCSFCTIPLARGISRSNSIEKTLMVAKKLSDTKVREIVLTGVNIGDFGKNNGETFLDLIKELDKLKNIDRIRISSIEPNLINEKIIDFCSVSKKIMPHFHIPLQSGSDNILSLMKRRYNTKLYIKRIEKIKAKIPDCCIGVDVMVGFPGETENDFMETYNFLKELPISYLHVFAYSERQNTEALKYKNAVPKKERSKRSKMLHILSQKKKNYFYNAFLGSVRPVLFESRKNGKLIGHTDNYIKVELLGNIKIINKIVMIKLIEINGLNVIGELL